MRPFPLTRTLPSPGTVAALTVTEALDALVPPPSSSTRKAAGSGGARGGRRRRFARRAARGKKDGSARGSRDRPGSKARCRLERTSEVIWTSQTSGSKGVKTVVVVRLGRPRIAGLADPQRNPGAGRSGLGETGIAADPVRGRRRTTAVPAQSRTPQIRACRRRIRAAHTSSATPTTTATAPSKANCP